MQFLSTKCVFSPDRRHRYVLERIWDRTKPFVAFCGLNPSTADEIQPDPTVTRCVNFAVKWGYGGMYMTNAFAYRATDPDDMRSYRFPVGPDNDYHLRRIFGKPKVEKVVLCWGANVVHLERYIMLSLMVAAYYDKLYAFTFTQDGHPGHPLYLPNRIRLKKVRRLPPCRPPKRRKASPKPSNAR